MDRLSSPMTFDLHSLGKLTELWLKDQRPLLIELEEHLKMGGERKVVSS
jgi:hypothetical protein